MGLYSSNLFLHTHTQLAKPFICLYNVVGVEVGEHEDRQSDDDLCNQSDDQLTLKSVYETKKSSFCIQLMIVYVFQTYSDWLML